MEFEKASPSELHPTIHRIQLEPDREDGIPSGGEEVSITRANQGLAIPMHQILEGRRINAPRKAGIRRFHLPFDPPLSSFINRFRHLYSRPPSPPAPTSKRDTRSQVDQVPPTGPSDNNAFVHSRADGHRLVGRRQHIVWNWSGNRLLLGQLALGSGISPRPFFPVRHWLGRDSRNRIGGSPLDPPRISSSVERSSFPSPLRQRGSNRNHSKRPMPISGVQRSFKEDLPLVGSREDIHQTFTRSESRQHFRRAVPRRRFLVLEGFPQSLQQSLSIPPISPPDVTVLMMSNPPTSSSSHPNPSSLLSRRIV